MGKRDVMDLETAESIARDQVVGGTSVLGPRATAALLKEIDRLRAVLAERDTTIAAVRALHTDAGPSQGYLPVGGYGDFPTSCSSCGTTGEYAVEWPCPTMAALSAPVEAVGPAEPSGAFVIALHLDDGTPGDLWNADVHSTAADARSVLAEIEDSGTTGRAVYRLVAELGTPAAENDGGV